MRLVFLDTETTGLSDYDRLCQVAYKEEGKEMVECLYKPPVDIGVEAMSVHHITTAMVRDKAPFIGSVEHEYLKKTLSSPDVAMVAHNAPFDSKMIVREGIEIHQTICTIKVARYLLAGDPKFKKFSLQMLKYSFGIELEDAKAHDAAGDVRVLEAVFTKLYDIAVEKGNALALERKTKPPTRDQILRRFVQITEQPESPETIRVTFGKHNGEMVKDAVTKDPRYFEWWLGQQKEGESDRHNPDFKKAVEYYLKHGKSA